MEDSAIYQSDNIPRIIAFLQHDGLLNRSINCQKCKTPMQLKDREAGDKKTWRCPKYSCQTFASARNGSWFCSNRIRLKKILKLIFSFFRITPFQEQQLRLAYVDLQYRITFICFAILHNKYVFVSQNIIIFNRYLCALDLNIDYIKLGSENIIIEID